jgi:hypothetical protein
MYTRIYDKITINIKTNEIYFQTSCFTYLIHLLTTRFVLWLYFDMIYHEILFKFIEDVYTYLRYNYII